MRFYGHPKSGYVQRQRLNHAQPPLVYRDSTNCTLLQMANGHGALKLEADDVCPVAECVVALDVTLPELTAPVDCDCAVTEAELEAAVVARVLWAVLVVDDTINVGVAAWSWAWA